MWTWPRQPVLCGPQWLNCPNLEAFFDVQVDCNSVTDTFGCRIAVDLTGTASDAFTASIARSQPVS